MTRRMKQERDEDVQLQWNQRGGVRKWKVFFVCFFFFFVLNKSSNIIICNREISVAGMLKSVKRGNHKRPEHEKSGFGSAVRLSVIKAHVRSLPLTASYYTMCFGLCMVLRTGVGRRETECVRDKS